MSAAVAQPIAGVSSNRETEIEVVYPSVAAGPLGKLINNIMGWASSIQNVPMRLLICMLCGILVAPLAAAAYGLSKTLGNCYVLTNRSIRSQTIIGARIGQSVSLEEIDRIEIETCSADRFHRLGNLTLKNAQGGTLLVIRAIGVPERFRQVIHDVQAVRKQTNTSLRQIQARHTPSAVDKLDGIQSKLDS